MSFLDNEAEKLTSVDLARIASILRHQVRGVLMQELGLTRDSVRAEAREIIESTLQKETPRVLSSGAIEALVAKEVMKRFNLKEMLEIEIRSQARQLINDKLTVQLKP